MIDLYTWATPNGRKASIALEEFGIPYTVHPVNIVEGQQFLPEFTAISPNQKIPVIVDQETGISLMESGAILLYLADKTGQLLPSARSRYWETVEWLMWQKAGLGPMLGQVHHFVRFNKGKSTYSEGRFLKEAHRLYSVLDRRLSDSPYIVGDEYTIADIAAWPWISRFEYQSIDLSFFPNVLDWYLRIAHRPAVQAGYAIPLTEEVPIPVTVTA
jgi:GST-like protein